MKEIEDNIIGIYCIFNKTDGKRYIGSSVNVRERIKKHFRQLKSSYHGNQHLQSAFKKYGQDSFGYFVVEILESEENLLEIEQIYIDTLFCLDDRFGYNIRPKADSSRISENTKEKLRQINLGRKASSETREKMSLARRGKKFSESHRKNLGLSNIKRHGITEETKTDIIKMYLDGETQPQIVKKHNISRGYILKVVKEANIPLRGRSHLNYKGENNPVYKHGRRTKKNT